MPEHDTIEEVKPAVSGEADRVRRSEAETERSRIEEGKPEVVPAGHEYDTPPKEWVAGTVVPKDTAPEDMTPAEYAQWMYENLTPFWAIKKNLLLQYPPTLSGLEPSTAAIGDPSFTLKVSGTGFVVHESVIVFAGQDEPTQLNADGTVSTGVNMGVWHGADTVQVSVRNGAQVSEPLEFTFTAPAGAVSGEAERSRMKADEPVDETEDEEDDEPVKKSKAKSRK